MNQPIVDITPILSIPFQENAFLAHLQGRSDCLVFDPGLEPEKILAQLDSRQLTPAAILNTHGHADHIAGNAALKERWPDCPLIIGQGDAYKLTDPAGNLSAGFGVHLVSPSADRTVNEGDLLSLAGFELEVRETPGHSAGHVVFITRDLQPIHVLGGDVLFAGSIGRTDFPDGNTEQLLTSIREKLFSLPDDTIIYPGHGPNTTVGREKQTNPFVGVR